MLGIIESISMMLLCLQAAYLTYHCHTWKGERTQFTNWGREFTTELSADFKEFGHLLTDIADILENGAPTQNNPTPSNVKDIITNLLISKASDALSGVKDGNQKTENSLGSIHEEFGPALSEQIQGSIQREISTNELRDVGRNSESNDGNESNDVLD